MSSFVKHYRPMNMAERQRRHDIKDLEAQVRRSGVWILESVPLVGDLPPVCAAGAHGLTCMLHMPGEYPCHPDRVGPTRAP